MRKIIKIIMRLVKASDSECCENCIFANSTCEYCYHRHNRTAPNGCCLHFTQKGDTK